MKFEPISYEHAARLIGRRPWDVSRDAELLAMGHIEATRRYGCDGCVVGLDIYNIEIEAYGCEILEPVGDGVPIAGKPPLNDISQLLSLKFDPVTAGRVPMIFEAAEKIKNEVPEADVRIPISGPFTIACHLLGMENMICELFTNSEKTLEALLHLAEGQLKYGLLAMDRGFKVSIFESSVTPPLLSPQLFHDWALPALGKIVDGLNENSENDTQFIIGGDTIHIMDSIFSVSPRYIICPVETDQKEFMARVGGNQETTIRVNMDPAVFLPGNKDEALTEAKRVVDIAKCYENIIDLSVGALMPFEADSDIILEVAEFVDNC